MLRIYTFGGLRIEHGGQPLQLSTQKARDLLAYLVTFRDRAHPRPVLAGILWPDLPEGKARRRLSDTLWRVRRALGDLVMANEERVWLNAKAPYWLDVQEFEIKRQEAESREQGTDSCFLPLASCAQLYLGPFLDGLYHDWVLLERERLQELYLETLKCLLEYNKQTGDYTEALSIAQQLVTAEPLHEAAHRELMRLYHLLGRDAEAVAQYQCCREILHEEMEVDPAPETEELYQTLSSGAPVPFTTPTAHLPTSAHHPTYDLDELPLVGRDTERSALLGLLETATSGRGGVALLEGEPGIGKSRLARELVAGARWRNVDAILVGVGEDTASSYALLVAALTPALTSLRMRQLAHSMNPVQLQAIAPLLPQITPVVTDLPLLPDLSPPQARERLQQAFVALILGLAQIAPYLWVLEDLQWADAETLSLLPLLLPHLNESRALLLLTGRSAELRANPIAWEVLQTLDRTVPFPRYTLTRLDVDDIGSLVRHLLGEDNPILTDHLIEESEGVPLYAVEALKAWRDEDHLLPGKRGGWHWQGDIAAVPSLQLGEAFIGHRLSHLSPATEEVLAAAAAIGTEVDFDLLACTCAPPDSTSGAVDSDLYSPAIDDLLRLGFLIETGTGYRFSHEQVRRAVYHRLSPTQCQKLHRRITQALEVLFPEQFEPLAHHHIAAGEREPAIYHLKRAAERSRELFAHQTTLAIYDRLLGLLTHAEDREARYDVLRDRAEVLGWIGDRDAQGRDLEEMIHLAETLSDDASRRDACLAHALHRRSEWHRLRGWYESANEDARAALEIYRQLGDEREQATLLCQLGWNIVYTPAASQAAAYFREALPICKSIGDLPSQLSCLSGLVAATKMMGDYARTLSYLQEHIALAETSGDPLRIGRALSNAGVIYYSLGDIEVAATYLQKALRFKETAGDRRSTAITLAYLGLMNAEHGEFKAAHVHLTTALETFREVQDAAWEGEVLSILGRLALWRGDPVTADEHLQVAYQRHRDLGEPAGAVGDLSYLALTKLALGDETAAWQHSQAAIDELEETSLEVEHSQDVYYNHFCVAGSTRHWAAARAALEKAARILEGQNERINDPALQEKYCAGRRFNRAIAEALADQPPPSQLRVRLARADAPAHRRPTADELVTVIWTVDAGEEDTDLADREGKVALRRHRLLRLLAEAAAADALPTVADLAGGLDFSPRTIRADLAALRRQGHPIRTRGMQA